MTIENQNEEVNQENATEPEVETTEAPSEPEIDYRKSYEDNTRELTELKKVLGRQAKELGGLRELKDKYSPMWDDYQNAQKSMREKQFQENPIEGIKHLFNETLEQRLTPIEKHYQEQLSELSVTRTHSELQEKLGTEYDTYRNVMADILKHFQGIDEKNGTKHAEELADQPDILIQMAEVAYNKKNKAAKSQGTQIAQTQAKRMSGIVTKSGSNPAPTQEFSGKSSKEMLEIMKKKGWAK